MILAREAWDACLRILVEQTCPNKPLSVSNLCWHVRHGGDNHWENPRNRYTVAGQKYNLALAKKFILSRGLKPQHFGVL